MTKEKKKSLSLQEQANEILARAQEKGVSTNFFFLTTFKRYQVQMRILTELEKAIDKDGPTITKEYVKNRQNICINPAITEYNKTATAANGTVSTLTNILRSFADEQNEEEGKSKLQVLMDAMLQNDE